jgi:hypothetical protein
MLLLLATTSAAGAAAKPAVPRFQQLELKAILSQIGAPDLAVVPTALPPHFGFESFSVTGTPPGLDVSLTDQRFIKTPKQAIQHEVLYDSAYLKGAADSCSSRSRKTLQVNGSTVYSDGKTVWRCLRSSRGRLVKTSAHGHLGESALASLVASVDAVR